MQGITQSCVHSSHLSLSLSLSAFCFVSRSWHNDVDHNDLNEDEEDNAHPLDGRLKDPKQKENVYKMKLKWWQNDEQENSKRGGREWKADAKWIPESKLKYIESPPVFFFYHLNEIIRKTCVIHSILIIDKF